MRIILTVLFCALIPGLFLGWLQAINHAFDNGEAYLPFSIGLGAYLILIGIRNRSFQHNFKWFQTFSHELTHVIFSILTFNKIYGFSATSHSGGYVSYQGKSNMLIALSPYCIPIFTIFLLIAASFIDGQHAAFMVGAVGFTYFFHVHTFFVQTRHYQPDLRAYGLIPSYSFIIFFNLLFSGLILWSVTDGLMGFRVFFADAYGHVATYLDALGTKFGE